MKALVGAFNQEKALVGAFSVIVKTSCGTDGSFYSTSMQCGHGVWPGAGWSCSSHMAAVTSHDNTARLEPGSQG